MGKTGTAVTTALVVGASWIGYKEYIESHEGTELSPACSAANMSFQDGLVVFPYNTAESPYKGVDSATVEQSVKLAGKWAILYQPDTAVLPHGTSFEAFAQQNKLSAMALRCINGMGTKGSPFTKDVPIYVPRQTFTTETLGVAQPNDTLTTTLTRTCGSYKSEFASNPPQKLLSGMIVGANCTVSDAGKTKNTVSAGEETKKPKLDPKIVSFIEKYGLYAREAEEKYGVPQAVSLAMAINESAYGTSKLTKDAHNFHGLKANSEWSGKKYLIKTWEVVSSNQLGDFTVIGSPRKRPDGLYDIDIMSEFKKFSSDREGFLGFGEHLRTRFGGDAYRDAFDHTDDSFAFFSALFDSAGAKYGTDPTYIKKVGSNVRAVDAYLK